MHRALLGSFLALPLALAAACGSRTPLLVGEEGDDGEPPIDAGGDASRDAPRDATPPPIDGNHPDVRRPSDCPDAAATLVYVLTAENELHAFDPTTATFRRIGVLACPTSATPWSMTVDRKGIAFAVFNDGTIFRVDTRTAACEPTPYVPDQQGLLTFGMGYVADTTDPGETLYVSDSTSRPGGGPSLGLAWIDTTTFTLHRVGAYDQDIPRSELTGTSDGRLFAYWPDPVATGSHIAEIDRVTAKIVGESTLSVGTTADAFAFAYWGGDFWVFTSPGTPSPTTVTRFSPATQRETTVTTAPITVVGAGVSTCAPE